MLTIVFSNTMTDSSLSTRQDIWVMVYYLWANKKACTAFQNEMPWPLEMYKYTQKAYEVLKREKKNPGNGLMKT